MFSELLKCEHIDLARIDAQVFHLQDYLKATDPKIAIFLTAACDEFFGVIFHLYPKAVAESRIGHTSLKISLQNIDIITDFYACHFIECVLRNACQTDFLHQKGLNTRIDMHLYS